MTDTTADASRDTTVIGLVGVAHLHSHFYQIALGPLVPAMMLDFGVGYTELGLYATVFFAVSGISQAIVGILVDRFGAVKLLMIGLAMLGGATALVGLAPSYLMILPLAAIAGLGNSVFHPADFSILSERISQRRLGRAFSIHAFGGTLGYVIAPTVILALSSIGGWRFALIVSGLSGVFFVLLLWAYRRVLTGDGPINHEQASLPTLGFYANLLRNGALMSAFAYMALIAAGLIGLQYFSVSAVLEIFAGSPGVSIDWSLPFLGPDWGFAFSAPLPVMAAAALTAFLGGSAVGILLGGELVDRWPRHARIAIMGLTTGALCMAAIGLLDIDLLGIVALMGVAGVAVGITSPARDILVKSATPKGASGKVFGFVYSGLDLGGALAPWLLFGPLMDGGAFQTVFLAVAVIYLITVLTVFQLSRGALQAQAA